MYETKFQTHTKTRNIVMVKSGKIVMCPEYIEHQNTKALQQYA
jgi:hypothetical protein